MATDNLQTTLTTLLQSGTQSNPVLNELLADYARYHFALVILGGAFTLLCLGLSIFCWIRFKKLATVAEHGWTFEKKTFFSFGIIAVIISLLMALIVVVNISNAVNYRKGFTGALTMLSPAQPNTPKAAFYQSFATWLQSENTVMPLTVKNTIDERLGWQLPKAIICSILLVIFTFCGVRIWSSLIKRSRVSSRVRSRKETLLLALGIAIATILPLLVVMVIANTQAVLAPIVLTLLFA